MDRLEIANHIKKRLDNISIEKLVNDYRSSGPINHLIIDNFLPLELAILLCRKFPPRIPTQYA